MRRYVFLREKDIFEALNKVRDAFLAAKDGNEVNKIIDGLLTYDEKLKIGRRILIAQCLKQKLSIEQTSHLLKVGKNTVMHVSRRLEKYEEWFELIEERSKKVEKEYEKRRYKSTGSPKLVKKNMVYTGFTRKQVKRL